MFSGAKKDIKLGGGNKICGGRSLLNDFGGEKLEKMENDPTVQLSTEEYEIMFSNFEM